ncbi:ABC transporter [Mesotoga sp. Brook.08.YT.4.2.5.1]|uniref:LPS export ABC transporter ATP-binding protein n=1 Tax=unclassified Mesotoga TaxID=1184398 RepID=UPI000C99AF6B|nr:MULTISPECIES: LPS export ABC transporter ATP-binding protein [unclassified Mesotoga]PNQ05167.1 ABC transporter [Mesotoga sp. SC_NapDC3]PXF34215.1 ABC transporter [Mesotoga sp. SC_NapDC]RIZ61111.1 ABC transporter [Mesotoga sp. SC_NapDC2]PNE22365.1 ABC transporter [Mesotoga sp. Brook.08.YT.4.2.5.1]RAO96368.1 ABC transporter ATP-binding protein [Mesotoga sp. Brook.08.YT.4.2.5.4.]
MSDPSYLKCEHLDKRYGRRRVLKDVSIEASSLEVVGLLGPNGAGKTTAFRSILGIVIPNTGSIFLNGENITHLPIHERAKRGIAYLPQETSIFRGLKVIENLTMVMRLTGQEESHYERASEILDEFGILSLKDQVASSISGGEKRRLEFARTMTLSPSFILLDEPFVGIDPMTVKDIQKMIRKLKSRGIGVIVTDHDVSSIAKVVDRLYVLYKGEVISSGDPEEVLGDSQVVEKYLGSDD